MQVALRKRSPRQRLSSENTTSMAVAKILCLKALRQKWNRAEKRSIVPELGCVDPHLSPIRPGMFIKIFLNCWKNILSTFHYSAPHDQNLGIVGMYHRQRCDAPDFQTTIANLASDCILFRGCLEQLLKVQMRTSSKLAGCYPAPFFRHEGKRPSRRLCLRATDRSTNASSTVVEHR